MGLIRTSDPRVTYGLHREKRGGNWVVTVYVAGRSVTSCGCSWQKPAAKWCERIALQLAAANGIHDELLKGDA